MIYLGWLLWLWSALTWAHPMDVSFYGHQQQIYLSHDQVVLHYQVEIPIEKYVRQAPSMVTVREQGKQAAQEQFDIEMLQELEWGLSLVVAGQNIPWERIDLQRPTREFDGKFMIYRLGLRGALPPGSEALSVVNDCYSTERPAYFSTQLYVASEIELHASTLSRSDGPKLGGLTGQWTSEEIHRDIGLAFETHCFPFFPAVLQKLDEFRFMDTVHVSNVK